MNPCERTDSLLSFFLDDEVSPAERRFVEGHLTACPRCREQLRELGVVMNRLRRLPAISVSDGFTESVVASVLGRPAAGLEEPLFVRRPGVFARWAPPLAAAAAIGAVAILGVMRWYDPAQETASGPVSPPIVATAVSTDDGSPGAVVHVLGESDPGFQSVADSPPTSLGAMYVREDWVLTRPTGGGEPVLTRVGATPDGKVLVSF